jgi:hypothetical protein
MAGSLSEYAAGKVLNHALGVSSWTMPTTYIGLWTSALTSASTGATAGEATYTGYARIATSGAWGSVTNATPETIFNTTAITFAACTASTSTVTYFGIFDSITVGAGNLIAWGTCTSTVISSTQTPATFAINALELTLSAS